MTSTALTTVVDPNYAYFNCQVAELEEIGNDILDLYESDKTGKLVAPTVNEKAVNSMPQKNNTMSSELNAADPYDTVKVRRDMTS